MKKISFVLGLVILGVAFLSSCQKEGNCYECTHPTKNFIKDICPSDTLNYFQVQSRKDDHVSSGYDCVAK